MSKKAIAMNMAILILIIVILAASLVGVWWYYSTQEEEEVIPPPGEFEFSDLTISEEVVAKGESVTITVNVTNTAGAEITGTITLLLNDRKEAEKSVTIDAGASTIVSFTVTKDPDTYEVTIAGATVTGTFIVLEEAPSFVKDNKVVFESGATYQWFDPHVSYYQFDYWTLWHTVETLLWYEMEDNTKIIEWLAETYDESEDRLKHTFTLREDIEFQDGTPFNAEAVWFSLNRILIIDGTSGTGTPGSQAAWMTQQLLNHSLSTAMSGEEQAWDPDWVQAVLDQNFVHIVNDYEVELNILNPTTQFQSIFSGPWSAIISPTSTIEMDYEYYDWDFEAEQTPDLNFTKYFEHMAGVGETGLILPEDGWMIGTGPYYIESVEATVPYRITLKAYDDYWGGPDDMNLPPAGKTRIETIEYVYIPSFTTRLLDLKAGTATGIAVPTDSIYQVVDRDKWIDEGILESIIPGVIEYGTFPQFTTWWLDYNTNVTNIDGTLRDWQPFADWRIRMAVASSVNMTDMNINVNNRLGVLASNIVPPDTAPPHAYTDVGVTFSFDLDYAEELLLQANATPLTSFNYYNGTPVTTETIDNSFGPDFAHSKTVEFYVQAGADTFQAVLTQMSDTLNTIADDNDLGIRFNVVIVPGGQQYTLASSHLIDSYMGGWIADYNHVLNWLGPMYLSSGTYFSWNLWNLTALDDLYWDAVAADEAGDVDELLSLTDQMNTIANEHLTYMMWWHPTLQFARSEWLKGPLVTAEHPTGWWVNTAYGVDLWSTMYYEEA